MMAVRRRVPTNFNMITVTILSLVVLSMAQDDALNNQQDHEGFHGKKPAVEDNRLPQGGQRYVPGDGNADRVVMGRGPPVGDRPRGGDPAREGNAEMRQPPPGQPVGQQDGHVLKYNKGKPIKLAEHPDCESDVKYFCATGHARNNFAVLDCLQQKNDKDVSKQCQNLLWNYKKNLTSDIRFDSAASEVCSEALEHSFECKNQQKGSGFLLSCLIEKRSNITQPNCRLFLNKMAGIVFSDYTLIYKFADKCNDDINRLKCGRVQDGEEGAPHSQGKTLECLSESVSELTQQCKDEILHVAELQSDDYHTDRALFYACRDDRDRLCANVKSGGGKVYKCLFRHKFDREMSSTCRKALTGRQKLMQEDYKINKNLAVQCREDINRHGCMESAKKAGLPFKHARISDIILCLESADKQGGKNGKGVLPECMNEVKDVRHSMMEDFKINPEIVRNCATIIQEKCNGGLEREGKTVHCLLDQVRRQMRDKDSDNAECKVAIEDLLHVVDPGEQWDTDPVLKESCQSVVSSQCHEISSGEGKIISCLMKNLDHKSMTDECKERLMEIQYFLVRDFRFDPRLYNFCRKEAKDLCHASGDWFRRDEDGPHSGPLVFSCLYRHLRLYSTDGQRQLSRACAHEVRRVMRERAVSVALEPRIEQDCLQDLSSICSEETNKGDEMECLQKNFDDLQLKCKYAVGNFTRDEDEDVELNRILIRACTPVIKEHCTENVNAEDLMECLIIHKNDENTNHKCAAGIEHHQLITMSDYRFSTKFKENCKTEVMDKCKNSRSKVDVVKCLSEHIRNDTLLGKEHRIKKKCRKQLRFELMQRASNIDLDPELKASCDYDIKNLCPIKEIQPGRAAVIECLKSHRKDLSEACHAKIFKRELQQTVDVTTDFLLMQVCKRMIKQHCFDAEPSELFKCLKKHKSDDAFDSKCRKTIIERMRMKNLDYRFNPNLRASCQMDITKFCKDELTQITDKTEAEGVVIRCLKITFAKKKLSDSCRDHVRTLIKEVALDYKQDPRLAEACKQEIVTLCKEAAVSDSAMDSTDHGKMEECLKEKLAAGAIKNERCSHEVVRVLAEDRADVQVDPLLFRACANDIKHYCFDVPQGEGRQMSCLLAALEDRQVRLKHDCERMLRDRVTMWQYAAKVAPPETINEVVLNVMSSPQRNYFMSIFFLIVAAIFVGGLCCGRVTKRVRAELKNK